MGLSMEDMRKLLKGKDREKQDKSEANKKANAWLDEDELKEIAKVYHDGERTVMIRGKEFNLIEDKKWREVKVRPVEGYVPFARVEIETLEKAR